jgi:hypothetical protein
MLTQLAAVHESIEERGGSVIGIAPGSEAQASHLMKGPIPYELFVDADQLVSTRVGIGTQSLSHFLFSLPAWWRYLKAFFSGHWQRRITGHISNVPGVCVVDANGRVAYLHKGTGLGDYPPVETVLDELSRLLTS